MAHFSLREIPGDFQAVRADEADRYRRDWGTFIATDPGHLPETGVAG
jgi:hypothetical protein